MASTRLQALVLAAGRSSRFHTSRTKLSFTLCGQEMILHPLGVLQSCSIDTTLIVGYQQETLKAILKKNNFDITCIEQTEQRGTGHAVLSARHVWHADTLLIMNGDMPLVSKEIITQLIERHQATDATITLAAAYANDSHVTGYGRIIHDGSQIKIVESRDFKGDRTQPYLLNAGIYLIKREFLEQALPALQPHPGGELYITDLIQVAGSSHKHVECVIVEFDYVRGVNTLKELATAEQLMRSDIITHFMKSGVRFVSPGTVIIDKQVHIGSDTTIGAGVHLRGKTHIGQDCLVDAYAIITESTIADQVQVLPYSVITQSIIQQAANVGPFVHIKNQTLIGERAVIGNFVEVTKSTLGSETKAKHLAYLGNATIGNKVNFGAGSITCNYNGILKQETHIHDNAFIGSNCSLVAPVTIGADSMIGAGSVITKDVPAQALAFSRAAQVTKEGYVHKLKKKYRDQKEGITFLRSHTPETVNEL